MLTQTVKISLEAEIELGAEEDSGGCLDGLEIRYVEIAGCRVLIEELPVDLQEVLLDMAKDESDNGGWV